MKLTSNELYQLVRCSEWLESGDDNPDPEQKKYDKFVQKLAKKLRKFYVGNQKEEYKLT